MSVDLNALRDLSISNFYSSLDTPRALTCYLLWKNNEHIQLAGLTFDPYNYNSLSDARDALSATKYLSKANFLSTNIDLEKSAISKFKEAELACESANQRIVSNKFENSYSLGVLMSMTRKIERIIGEAPDPEELIDACNWGPGSTVKLRKSVSTHPKKFSSENQITANAYEFCRPWFQAAFPLWECMFEIIPGSKIVTVPKNAMTDRTIEINPGMNLFFQKGIGSVWRKCLKGIGIDLAKQSINQKKSRLASIFNDCATVDFSSASDTVCFELVNAILPERWMNVARAFRSCSGQLADGSTVNFSKFSSMGNGFTFELETMIFYTMATACCDVLGVDSSEVSVYGDDVILPSSVYELYCAVSKDLGFTINVSKSYNDSYYRESCGAHYWNGASIKPIFLRESFNGLASIILSANNIRRFARSRRNSGCDSNFLRCYEVLTKYLGPQCPRISEGYGDVGLIENIEEASVTRAGNGYEGNFVRVWSVVAAQEELTTTGLYLTRLKSIGNSSNATLNSCLPLRGRKDHALRQMAVGCSSLDTLGMGNNIPIPGRTKLAKTRLLIPLWENLGPWY